MVDIQGMLILNLVFQAFKFAARAKSNVLISWEGLTPLSGCCCVVPAGAPAAAACAGDSHVYLRQWVCSDNYAQASECACAQGKRTQHDMQGLSMTHRESV
jgi:hypothetical protein